MDRAGIICVAAFFLLTSLPEISTSAATTTATTSCKLKLAHKTRPNLPKNLRGVRSELMVRVEVNADGRITVAEVIRGTGNREVDAAVVKAMHDEWRYKPLHDCATAEEAITVRLDYRDNVLH